MSILTFIRDVLCAPYSIPIGLINNKRTIGMCGETTKKELKLKETTTNSKGYKGSIGTQTEDVSSITNYEMLNLGIQDILRRNQTVVSQTVRAENKATIDCPLVVPLEEDPLAVYDTKLRNITEVNELKDGTTVELPAFGCCPPVVSQITTINASSWENITEIDIEDIYNEIDLNLENTLVEQGGGPLSDTKASVTSNMEIKNILKQKIREIIKSTTSQNINISQSLHYIDRYGRCEHYMDDNGDWRWKKKTLEQSITIDMLSKNIIDSTNKIIMRNQNEMDSKTKTVVNRITNYRVIVASLLWNVIICYAILKLFMNFLNKMN